VDGVLHVLGPLRSIPLLSTRFSGPLVFLRELQDAFARAT